MLTTKKLRPEYLKKKEEEYIEEDMRNLLQRKGEFVAVVCPACASSVSCKKLEKYELDYVTCSVCGTMYVNPRPTSEILEVFYSTSQDYKFCNEYIFPSTENIRREKIFKPRAMRLQNICESHNINTDLLIEVGGGFGIFCEEIKKTGFFNRVIAIEPTPSLAQTCRGREIEVIETTIEKLTLQNCDSPNVIAAFDVIEHLFSPRDFLRKCLSLLAPGGIIVLTCPNINGFDVVVLKELSNAVEHGHLNFFNPTSLANLLNNCGFKILEVLTPGKLDAELVRDKILEGKLDISNQLFLKQVLIDRWSEVGSNFQQFLSENLLSSHMWAVARKA